MNKQAGFDNLENNGVDNDELYGLNLEERKRQRSQAHSFMDQTKQKNSANMDSTLSNVDCVGTPDTVLAKLAEQASRGQ